MSLSVLPPSAYQPLLAHTTQPGALRAWPQLPRLGWVLGQVSAVQLAGAALFLLGNALQCHSHWLLARLAGKAQTPRYRIPRGASNHAWGWLTRGLTSEVGALPLPAAPHLAGWQSQLHASPPLPHVLCRWRL